MPAEVRCEFLGQVGLKFDLRFAISDGKYLVNFRRRLFYLQESNRNFRTNIGANFGANFGDNFGNFVSDFAPFFGNFVQQKGGAKISS